MKARILFILLLIGYFAAGCSAPAVFELATADEEFNFHHGRELVWREDSTATTLLNFENYDGSNFSFYTEITNNSNEPYEVDPSNFYVEVLTPEMPENARQIAVIDPEKQIDAIDNGIADNEKSKDAAVGFNLIAGLFTAAVNIATDAPAEKVVDDIAYWGSSAYDESVRHDIEKENLQDQKRYWQNEVMRKTTINPGEDFGGTFYVPVNRKAARIKLVMPLNNTIHEFIFEQRKIK